MPRLVRFRQLLNPVKKDLFLKFLFRKTQKVPYEILTFLLGKLYHKYILHYTVIILLILNAEFGLIWTTPWPDENDFFFKILKNSQFAKFAKVRMKTHFFLGKLYQQLFCFALSLHCDTPYRVSLDLDNTLTRWKRPIFKIPFSQSSKSFVWKPNFFPMKAIQKLLFALHFHYTGGTPCHVWLDLDNSLTRWQRPIFKTPFSQNSKKSVWNSNFFAGQAIPQTLFALHCHYTVDTQCRVWFDLENSLTRWKRTIFKIR